MISVIIPAYNSEKTLGKCLSSLQEQTRKPDEIIVVDDGSADKTIDVVKSFKNVSLLAQAHKGPAAARNLGANKAKGKILLFTDADCVPGKTWVAEMAGPFEDKDIVGVQGRYETGQKGLMARFVQLEIEDRYDRMRKRKYIDFIGSYAAGYRKDIFMRHGGFDESFVMASGEDPDISFKLAKAGHKMVFNENAIVYHNHVDSLGTYLKQKFWRAYWRVLLYRKHPEKMAGESYTPQTLKLQIFLLGAAFLSIIASIFSSQFLTLLTMTVLLLFITTLPLSLKNMKKSLLVGMVTPFISILRTVVFVFGLVYGVLKI
jgi:glycosyltransferase involved in cell wall biosynthesis